MCASAAYGTNHFGRNTGLLLSGTWRSVGVRLHRQRPSSKTGAKLSEILLVISGVFIENAM